MEGQKNKAERERGDLEIIRSGISCLRPFIVAAAMFESVIAKSGLSLTGKESYDLMKSSLLHP